MAGGPDILFDTFDAMADNNKKKTVFWPVQTMLLILCPDILGTITGKDPAQASSGKGAFLSNLKKSLKAKNLADVAAISYVDICKACTFVSKSDKTSALRAIVPEIENDLKDRLFDVSHPFVNADGEIDQQIMIDCLVASFRLNARNAVWSLFPIMLHADAPPVFKLVLLKSLLQIGLPLGACPVVAEMTPLFFMPAAEEHRLPWNPTLSATYANLASPLRKLFQEYLAKDRLDRARLQDKTKKKAPEEAKTELEIQMSILDLYHQDPKLVLTSTDPKTQREESRNVIHGLTICLQEPAFRAKAAEALLRFHETAFIEQWGPPGENMQSFWEISSLVVNAVARYAIDKEDVCFYVFVSLLVCWFVCLLVCWFACRVVWLVCIFFVGFLTRSGSPRTNVPRSCWSSFVGAMHIFDFMPTRHRSAQTFSSVPRPRAPSRLTFFKNECFAC